MHPANILLAKLGLTVNNPSPVWRWVYHVLSLLAEHDTRSALNINPFEDVLQRIRESGVSDESAGYVELEQLLEPMRTKYHQGAY